MMKRSFWRSVTRINVRALFLLALALMIAAALWWTGRWRDSRRSLSLTSEQRQEQAAPRRPEQDAGEADRRTALRQEDNPFTSEYLEETLRRAREEEERRKAEAARKREEQRRRKAEAEAARRKAAEREAAAEAAAAKEAAARKVAEQQQQQAAAEEAQQAKQAQPAPQPEPEPEPAPKPKPPERIEVLYRGLLRRPDGEVLALLESPEGTRFYSVGAAVAGYRLQAARRGNAVLQYGEDEPVTLEKGLSVSLIKR